MPKDFYNHKGELEKEHWEIEKLMMPGTYQPRKHRSRSMPQRKPRLNATPKDKVVYTSESE